jgi:arylsulfatase A-like enzyme
VPPSIVLISIDSLRYDCVSYQVQRPHLDAVGIADLPHTPHLDRFMEGSYAFTQAVATAPYTTTSHASILTGRIPTDHGVRSFMSSGLSPDVLLLPEMLAPLGYASMLMSDTTWLFRTVGLDRGFDDVTEDLEAARRWWQDHEHRPRLLLIHLLDLHDPYGFRKPSRALRSAELLDENVRWLDELEASMGALCEGASPRPARFERPRQVMRHARMLHSQVVSRASGLADGLRWYLKALERIDRGPLRWIVDWFGTDGVFDSSIVATFGDHGEGRDPMSNFRLGHSCAMFDDVIRVPLTVRMPGQRIEELSDPVPRPVHAPVCLVEEQCSLVDLVPTLLELAGGAELAEQQGLRRGPVGFLNGRSLLPAMSGRRMPVRPAYGEFWQRWKGRRNGRIIETLRQRTLRWPDRKLSLIGRDLRYGRELSELDTKAYILKLCSDLGGHPADDERRWNILIRWAARGGPITRRCLFWLFQQRAKSAPIPKAAIYDLVGDPLEAHPRREDCVRPRSAEYRRALELFERVDRHARPPSPLRGTRKEMFAVEDRLRDLGYVE